MNNSISKQSLLITGGSGFIGANLVRSALAAGYEVHTPCRAAETPWRLADINDSGLHVYTSWNLNDAVDVFGLVNSVKPDVVIHAAAHGSHSSERDVSGLFMTNVAATATLAEACSSSGTEHLILLGSVLEYEPSGATLSESSPLIPETLYGLTKALSCRIGEFYNRTRMLAVTELRLFNIFGPWDDARKLIPYVVTHALQGETVQLTSGEQERDFVFVDDVTRAVLVMARGECPSGQPYNVCSGSPISVAELARLIIRISGSDSIVQCGAVKERGDQRSVVTGKTRLSEFGLNPSTSLEVGLQRTIDWYRSRISL